MQSNTAHSSLCSEKPAVWSGRAVGIPANQTPTVREMRSRVITVTSLARTKTATAVRLEARLPGLVTQLRRAISSRSLTAPANLHPFLPPVCRAHTHRSRNFMGECAENGHHEIPLSSLFYHLSLCLGSLAFAGKVWSGHMNL